MKLDSFEQLLRRQPLRPVPEEWRGDLLAAARSATTPRPTVADPTPWTARLRDWLWPSPVAWGALAACWVAIATLNHLAAPSAPELARAQRDARLAAAYFAALRDPLALKLMADPQPLAAPGQPRRPRPGVGRLETTSQLLPV